MQTLTIGVDTGGTFCDFVVFDEAANTVSVFKESSTPDAPDRAILAGLQRALAGRPASDIGLFLHGTTVATNALLEGKGARAGLVITEGFRGIYEVQEQARPYGAPTFDLHYRRPPLLVPARRTVEVRERVGADGTVVTPFDEASARAALETLRAEKVEAIAVCFLFSFLHSAHEERIRELAAEILPGVPVSLSSALAPVIREYYRLSTTVANAYLEPVVGAYLDRLDSALTERGTATPQRYLMLSNGGAAPIAKAGHQAAATVLSGLAGGVIGAATIGRAAGRDNVIAFDMGGTSCDVAVIVGGEPERRQRAEIAGRPLALPTLGVETLSAGGGTIARVDAAGLLEVGPDSAGAVPGPVSYGRGGMQPTVTDANVVLGYLGGEAALAGTLKLDVAAARAALAERLAAPLVLDADRAAMGVLKLIDVKMAEAVRAMATGRGLDLRDFTLIAFGGAGPLHAVRIAATLGIAEVLVPPYPGVTSALGLLSADVRYERIRSAPTMLEATTGEAVAAIAAELAGDLAEALAADRFEPAQTVLIAAVDLRYEGQGYEVTVPLEWEPGAPVDLADLRARFDVLHRTRFGHGAENARVELMAVRMSGVGLVAKPNLARPAPASGPVDAAETARRPVAFEVDGALAWLETPIFARAGLAPGHAFTGPAIVEQGDTTTLIEPGARVVVDAVGNLIVTMERGAS